MNSMYGNCEQYARELGITASFEEGSVILLAEIKFSIYF